MFAVVVDVDYVGKQQLKNLLKQFGNGVQLRPTYLVSSGKGDTKGNCLKSKRQILQMYIYLLSI